MTVSVIIPSHNNAELLAKTLAGFAAQNMPSFDWEVIVIDNNSSDESIAEVQRLFRGKIQLTLIQQPQLAHPFALCNARNRGIKLAAGEWIVSMDADTVPGKTYLKTLENFLKEWGNKSVIATGERRFIAADSIAPDDILRKPTLLEQLPPALSPSNYGLPLDRRLPTMKRLPALEHPWDFMHGCNVVYKREDALRVGGYHEAYDGRWGFEDIDFAYRMITHGGCEPLYAVGLHVYHQDLSSDKPQVNRYDKSTNPNWTRICKAIPGYREYKITKYRRQSDSIRV